MVVKKYQTNYYSVKIDDLQNYVQYNWNNDKANYDFEMYINSEAFPSIDLSVRDDKKTFDVEYQIITHVKNIVRQIWK